MNRRCWTYSSYLRYQMVPTPGFPDGHIMPRSGRTQPIASSPCKYRLYHIDMVIINGDLKRKLILAFVATVFAFIKFRAAVHNIVNNPEILGFLGRHEAIALDRFFDNAQRLAGVLGVNIVEA